MSLVFLQLLPGCPANKNSFTDEKDALTKENEDNRISGFTISGHYPMPNISMDTLNMFRLVQNLIA
jgi:hypothetical protein